jgi:hypothetical protein
MLSISGRHSEIRKRVKRRSCQHECHTKIGITNLGRILHHRARVRKQQTLEIVCFDRCVEDWLLLKSDTAIQRYNDTAIQEPEPGTGTWNRA